jgi:peptidoglycan glycosyltransferase
MERIMSRETAKTLQEYMRNNVQTKYGSQNFPGLTVCAKSGTSQLGGEEVSNAMFSGFVADEKYPLAFMVVVENGGYGSGTCVPILSKVLSACKEVMDAE